MVCYFGFGFVLGLGFFNELAKFSCVCQQLKILVDFLEGRKVSSCDFFAAQEAGLDILEQLNTCINHSISFIFPCIEHGLHC